MDPISSVAMATGLSWASGIRLYATIFAIGLIHRMGWFTLPDTLAVLGHTYVLATAGVLVVVEFLADKIALVDSLWDAVHTFIRIPAGALLAWGAMGGSDHAAVATVAALLGGALTGATHMTKAGTRALVNTSPEPVSNVVTSFAEDGLWLTGGALALWMPFIFLGLMALFVIAFIYATPKLIRILRRKHQVSAE